MIYAIKVELKPNNKQITALRDIGNGCRILYNYLLMTKTRAYKAYKINISKKVMSAALPDLKQHYPIIQCIPAVSAQKVVANLDCAYNRFFTGISKFPVLKDYSNTNCSFYLTNQICKINYNENGIKFSNSIGFIKVKNKLKLINEHILSYTIIQDGDKWFISILVESNCSIAKESINYDTTVGIDLGLKTLIVTDSGQTYETKKHYRKALKKLKRQQKRLAKSQKDSNNYKKKQNKIKRTHTKIKNKRKDNNHKITTEIVKNNSVICIEDLSSANLMRNHKMAMSIADVAWGQIAVFLEYKCLWYGKTFVKVPRFFPSTKRCSHCGHCKHKSEIPLGMRVYNCYHCDLIQDRDINAAINIKNCGYSILSGIDISQVSQGMAKPTDYY